MEKGKARRMTREKYRLYKKGLYTLPKAKLFPEDNLILGARLTGFES